MISVITFYYCTDTVHVSNRIRAIVDDRVILREDSRSELTGGELKSTTYKMAALTNNSSYKNPVRARKHAILYRHKFRLTGRPPILLSVGVKWTERQEASRSPINTRSAAMLPASLN